MSRLSDAIWCLERDLAKNPGTDAASLMEKRLILRAALNAWGNDRYQEGYGDGRRDTVETRQLAEELTEKGDNHA